MGEKFDRSAFFFQEKAEGLVADDFGLGFGFTAGLAGFSASASNYDKVVI